MKGKRKAFMALLAGALLVSGCSETRETGSKSGEGLKVRKGENLEVVGVEANTHDGNIPENILDGDLSTRWSAPDSAWITMDLGEVSEVSCVNIAFSKGDQRRTRFAIEVSENGKNYERLYYGESSGITDKLEKYTFTAVEARYVRILGWGNTSNGWNSLTEVEVIGVGTPKREESRYTGDFELDTAATDWEEPVEKEVKHYNAPETYLWERDFSGDWQEEWEIMDGKSFGLTENMEYLPSEEALRVHYPKGSINPGSVDKLGTPLGGAQFYTRAGMDPREEMELSYKVRFSENYDFVKGGKLPGLYGGDRNASGKRIPDGKSGWSTRFMWRAKGAGEVYTYMPSSAKHGSSLGRGEWHFEAGEWHEIVQRVRLNTPGESDGLIEVYLDGKRVFYTEEIVFRTVEDLKIDGIFFSTFFGGSDKSWASAEDVYVDFKDFKLAE